MTARRCPRCASRVLQPVLVAGHTNYLCESCHRCWRPEFGYLIELNPHACPGCDLGRPCVARHAAPSLGWPA